MTRKDYEKIAGIMRATYDEAEAEPLDDGWAKEMKLLYFMRIKAAHSAIFDITNALADYMESDNPNFNRSRFLAACGGK